MRQLIQIERRWKSLNRFPWLKISQSRCLHASPPLRNRNKGSHDVPFTVREFEQAGPNGDRIEFDENAGLKEEEHLLKAKIKQLEDELRIMREGPFGPNSEFMMALPPKEREIALNALKEHESKSPIGLTTNFDDPELDRLLEAELGNGENEGDNEELPGEGFAPARVQFRLKKEYKVFIKGLNRALEMVAADKDKREYSVELWKWYLRCKNFIPQFTLQVEQDVWDAIWESQLTAPECSKHLKTVAEDILACGGELQDQQWLVYIDSLHVLGLSGSAIDKWHEARCEGTSALRRSPNFWRLGAQLHADTDQALQAERIAYEAIDEKQGKNFRALMPVISAWARSSASNSRQKAWTCYLKVKTGLGEHMTMEDYDEISTALLAAQKPDLALAVFKDMLLARESSAYDSTALYKKASGYIEEVRASSITEEHVNGISIAALTILPRKYQNKYFYGSWIKKLIGLGEVDAAGAVVELMYERGVRPDTKHLNGILGGWFRSDSPQAWKRAERMGWAMIEKRIEYVGLRSHASYREAEAALSKTPEDVLIPSFVRRMVPRANLETFSVLLLYYIRQSSTNSAQQLSRHLSYAEIAPSASFYNQLLFLYRSKEDLGALWKCYIGMGDKGLRDLETFACVWDAANFFASNQYKFEPGSFPRFRSLFHEMQDWFRSQSPSSQDLIISQFPRAMYRQIIQTFASTRDMMGTVLALHGMKELFDLYPDDRTTGIIIHQVTQFMPRDRQARPMGHRKAHNLTTKKANIAVINKTLNEIESRRSLRMIDEGMDPEQVAEESPHQKTLDILTEFLVGIIERTSGSPDVLQWVTNAAPSMGIESPNVSHLSSRSNEVGPLL